MTFSNFCLISKNMATNGNILSDREMIFSAQVINFFYSILLPSFNFLPVLVKKFAHRQFQEFFCADIKLFQLILPTERKEDWIWKILKFVDIPQVPQKFNAVHHHIQPYKFQLVLC